MPRTLRRSIYVQSLLVVSFFLLLMILPSRQRAMRSALRSTAGASTFTVNSTGDGPDSNLGDGLCDDGSGACTLRAAIQQANAAASLDFIDFNVPANSTINLNTALDSIVDDLNINGPGAQTLRVQRSTAVGTPSFTIFSIFPNKNVSIYGLTISRGDFSAFFNQGSLVISNCIVDGNRHGVINRTDLVIDNSVISNSTETGVQNEGQPATTPTATINSSTISGNSLGGIFNQSGFASSVATLTVNNSTISANNFGDGSGGGITTGGIQGGTATTFINNSTISGNRALLSPGFAGGVTALGWGSGSSGTVTLSNSTVTANDAPGANSGAAGMIIDTTNGGSAAITLHNTIVAGNYRLGSTPSDITGTVNPASSFNLIGTGGSGGLSNGVNNNQVGVVNPGLGPLANNGGPTFTHALLPGSPAIDAANSAFTTDQRGNPRPIDDPNVVNAAGGNGSDIGAYEAHTLQVNSAADTDDGSCTAPGTGNGCTLREAINAANGETGAELINFAPGLTSGGPATITLLTVLPDVSTDLSIVGPGANLLTVERSHAGGTPSFRIFTINFGRVVSISALTVMNGRSADGVAGSFGSEGENGGGIFNFGTLTLTDVSLTGNRAGDGGPGSNFGGNGGKGGGIANSGTLTMTGCTISENDSGRGGDGINNAGDGGKGGGISNGGTLTMTGCLVDGNNGGRGADGGNNGGGRGGDGGGIQNTEGILNLTNVTISNNVAGDSGDSNTFGGSGGGIFVAGNLSVVTMVNSSVIGNSSGSSVAGTDGFGGGIMSHSTLFISGSTISGNTSDGPGGGIMARKAWTLSNSTVSGNHAQLGGGIYNEGSTPLTLTNATITGNSATANQGNGIMNFGEAKVRNSLIARNGVLGAPDLGGAGVVAFESQGHNLIGNADGSTGFNAVGDQAGTTAAPINPGLGPLANNGGPTATHALLPGSLAIDAADNCVLNNSCSPALNSALTTDQRGSDRASDGNGDGISTVDIGAYEVRAFQVTSTADTSDGTCAPVGTGNGCTLREAITAANTGIGPQIITFAAALTSGGPTTISLLTVLPDLSSDMTIAGPGSASLLVERSHLGGTPDFRIFKVTQGKSVTISGLAFANGVAGGVSPGNIGGNLLNDRGTVVISNCVIIDSVVGGALGNFSGTMTINDSTLSGNNGGSTVTNSVPSSTSVVGPATLTINRSTFTANGGNPINNSVIIGNAQSPATVTINNSTIFANSFNGTGSAAGVRNGVGAGGTATITINNSTISGNTNSDGAGAIYNAGVFGNASTPTNATITVNNSTVFGNTGGPGVDASGGVANIISSCGGCLVSVKLDNTILAGNFNLGGSPNDFNGIADPTSSSNLIGIGGSGGLTNGVNNNQVGIADVRLAPLANNGGPTRTHALRSGSPAFDAGNNTLAANLGLTTDQRGFPRIRDGADVNLTQTIDIGAFEADPSVEDIADKTISEDGSLSFNFNIGDAATAFDSVTATSSNTTLLPNAPANLNLTGSGSTRTLNILPVAGGSGTTTITVTVTKTISATLFTASDTFVLTVTPVADTPSVTNATTNEDTQTLSGLVISRNAADGTEVSHFKITGITNGALFQHNGTTPINNGDFILAAEGSAGLRFTPAANFFGTGSFNVQASLGNTNVGLGGGVVTASITVNAVAEVPTVTDATTTINKQTTSGLVVTRNAIDGAEVTHFLIENIQNGTLFKNDGTTQISNSTTITSAEGNAGLKFTPGTNLISPATNFSFQVRGATSAVGSGLSSAATATITVTCDATAIVTNTNDNGAGSLRAAISQACPGGTVTFNIPTSDPGFSGGVYTITLTSGELIIDRNLTIAGPGAAVLTVKRSMVGSTPNFRIFTINSGRTLTLSGVTLSNGSAPSGIFPANSGGAILNSGSLQITNAVVSGNTANTGGGITSLGPLTLTSTVVSGNTASVGGGGLWTEGGSSPMTIVDSSISGNTTNGSGGGIVNNRLAATMNLTINNSVISGNNAVGGNGGGIYNTGTQGAVLNVTLTNVTISGNSSGFGGGIANSSETSGTTVNMAINNGTIFGNSVTGAVSQGGGIANHVFGSTNTLTLRNTIVAGNLANAGASNSDISSPVAPASSFNLIGDGTGMSGISNGSNGNMVGTSVAPIVPLVAPLANNGGPTKTHALLAGSPALDAGNNALITNPPFSGPPFTDQRGTGFARIVDGPDADTTDTVDIGAYEAQVSVANITDQSINEDNSLVLFFNVGGAANITGVTATSSNTTLVPNSPANIEVTGSGSTLRLVVTPVATLFGASTITVTVNGNNSQTMTDTFVLTVNSVNDAPSYAMQGSQTVNENAGAQTVNNWASNISAGPANEAGQSLNFVIVNDSNPGLFAAGPAISSAGTLTYTPATGASGIAAISIALMDNGGTANGGIDTSATQTFNITVQDGGALQFSSATFSAAEDSGNAVITVARTGGTAGEARVNYATSNSTATAGQDYTTASGTLIFPDGVTSKTFNVPIANDAVDEPDESVNLTLTTPAGSGSLGTPSSAVLTINDNDPAPGISINDSAVTEGDSGTVNAVFTVSLSGQSSQTITVNYATANGTATAGSDYQANSGTLTFLPLETSKTITVTVNGDVNFEANETFVVNLSGAVNASISDSQGAGTITNDDAQGGFISFSQANYTVGEGGGSVTITVNRTNDLSGPATVDYATADDVTVVPCSTANSVASSRCDFTTALGTLRFAAGESSKTFVVLISQDNYVEGPEALTITLSNLTGGAALATPSTATLTITDDATEPAANPIDSADAFVRQHYHDFLNREADPAGLAFWTNQITECQQPGATCSAEVRRINVSAAFFLSIEFQETGYFVYRTYKSSYGNISGTPVPLRLNEFLPDTQQIGKGFVVGAPGAEQVLENNKVAYLQEFVARARFTTAYPTTLTPAQFVDALFANAGVTPSAADRNAAIAEFGGAGNTSDVPARARALRRVAENTTLKAQETNRAFVLMQYFGYLRRNPNDAPEANLDFGGYNFWLGKLNQFNGNFVDAEMVKAFIVSGEYRHRFGQ